MKKYGRGRGGIDPLREFLDTRENCITSPVSKRKFSIILLTHTPYHIHRTFRKLLLSSSGMENKQ
jgi:hypothetical protein